MITYLLTNYPALYFILSICLIVTGLLFVYDESIRQTLKRLTNVESEVSYFVSLNLLVILNDFDEGIYFKYLLSHKPIMLGYTYSELFRVDQSYTFTEVKLIKKAVEKIELMSNDIKTHNPPSSEETPYMDIGDIIRMKMGLLTST